MIINTVETTDPINSTPKDSFDWSNAVCDALIMGVLTFLTCIGGMSAVGVPEVTLFRGALIAGAAQTFTILALKRGLIKKQD